METIEEIIDPSFRTGVGAKGPWTLMKVRTDKGSEATIFAPAALGDEVTLEYNPQYKSYNAKKAVDKSVATDSKLVKPDTLSLVSIEKKLDEILSLLKNSDENEEIPFE